MRIKLPTGIVDGMDHFNYVEIDELRGKQQNYLADQDLVVGNIGHIPKILGDMILSLETEEGVKWKGKNSDLVFKLSKSDIETVLVKIREKTYGTRFYHDEQCYHCGHENKNLKLDLNKLEIKTLTLEELLSEKSVVLPKSEKKVVFKPLRLKDLFELIKITKDKQNSLITSIAALSIQSIDDKTSIKPSDLEDIPVTDLKVLGEAQDKLDVEGSIDTTIQIKCSKCTEEFEVGLSCLDSSFFDPSKGS